MVHFKYKGISKNSIVHFKYEGTSQTSYVDIALKAYVHGLKSMDQLENHGHSCTSEET
jgi:hypothetical protein